MNLVLAFSAFLPFTTAALIPGNYHDQIVLVSGQTKTEPYHCDDNRHCPPDEQCCNSSCIPETHDCCSASMHCFPDDYCFFYDNEVRCCPRGMSCIQMSGEVVLGRTVQWYERVQAAEESFEDWYFSVLDVTTSITVSASYTKEAQALYSSLSWDVVHAAHTLPTQTVAAGQTS
ncbi:hypothetical protein BDW68DRAFT_198502 [Aspergillus falconensis]